MPLPAITIEQREAALSELARLLHLVGPSDFVYGRIVRPEERFFPDPWTADLQGARMLLAWLLAYARLGGLQWDLRADDDPSWSEERAGSEPMHPNAAAWFAGVNEHGTYLFGVRPAQVKDPWQLAALLAHEVAHAWRLRHGVTVADGPTEEHLTELTTVFLGLGVLRAHGDASQRHSDPNLVSLSYAQGVQLALANNAKEGPRVLAALEPDQRGIAEQALTLYGGKARLALITRLELPPEVDWEPPAPIRTPSEDETGAHHHHGNDIVFRVPVAPYLTFFLGSLTVGAFGAMILRSPWPLLLPVALTPVAWFYRDDRCSAPRCNTVLKPEAAVCPRCGGRIVGRIRRRSEHEAAERRYLAKSDDKLTSEARELASKLLSGGDDPA